MGDLLFIVINNHTAGVDGNAHKWVFPLANFLKIPLIFYRWTPADRHDLLFFFYFCFFVSVALHTSDVHDGHDVFDCNVSLKPPWHKVWDLPGLWYQMFIPVSLSFLLSSSPLDPVVLTDLCADPTWNISGWILDRASTRELIPLRVAGGVTQSQPSTHRFTQD